MDSTLSAKSLRKLCLKGVIDTSTYWQMKKCRKRRTIEYKRQPFDINSFDEPECTMYFRFSRQEIKRLQHSLKVPVDCHLHDKTRFTGIEGMCIMLRRLSYPNRLCDLVKMFNRDEGTLSRICKWMVKYIYKMHCNKICSLNQPWILQNLDSYSQACLEAGSFFSNLVGFIDGTARPICRPKRNQKDQYSGYKKQHVIKYQSVVLPNGMIGKLDGPFNGRRHDSAILHLTNLIPQMKRHFVNGDGGTFTLYGDPGYSNQKFIKVGYKNYDRLSEAHRRFNADMSALRVSVEYGFGKILQQFAFLDFKKNQKLLLQPLKEMYYVAAILCNCQTCLRGNQVSKYFDCMPPTLDEYLA